MPDPDQKPQTRGDMSERDNGVETPGGLPQEDVDDRPDVSTVTPEDYPLDQRARGDVQSAAIWRFDEEN